MTWAGAEKAIVDRFQAQWVTTPIELENISFQQPSDSEGNDQDYVRLIIRDGVEIQISVGTAPLHRGTGIIIISVFVPQRTGTIKARIHCDNIAVIWRGVQISGITMRAPYITPVGEVGGWYQMDVTVPFIKDETY